MVTPFTPVQSCPQFPRLVPWLVLFATTLFAWGSFFRKERGAAGHLSAPATAVFQFLIAVYGGYFGGGIGFLMMAALTMAGLPTRNAGATKNALAGVMNAAAIRNRYAGATPPANFAGRG
jgi:uncharacterized membrane protein YfcA